MPEDTIEVPAGVLPEEITSGEMTFDEYVMARIESGGTAKKDLVDNLVANSAEYSSEDRPALMQTPPGILEKLGTQNRTYDSEDLDEFNTGSFQ